MIHTSTLTLKPIPPYDFELTGSIFSSGDPQICRYEHEEFWQVVRLNSKRMLATVHSNGTVDAPELSAELKSNSKITAAEHREAEGFIYKTFNLGLDLKPFYRAVKRDPVLKSITGSLKGLRFVKTASVFEALVDAICEQQISLTVARSVETKITKTFGDPVKIGAHTYYAFPTPQSLAGASTDSHGQARGNLSSEQHEPGTRLRVWEAPTALPVEGATGYPLAGVPVIDQLRACGLSQKKAEYVRDMSRMVADGQLNPDKFLTYTQMDDVIAELTRIRGIGLWTVEYVLIRGMGRLEAMPADDLGIRRCISLYYFHGEKITADQARETAVNWGPWRGLASFYLLSATRLGIEV